MSTIQSTKPDHTSPAAKPLCACTISWSIARQAVIAAQPDLNFNTTSSKPIELRITLITEHKATAELVDPASNKTHTIELGAPRITLVHADPYTHIEITDGNELVLSATLNAEADVHRLLYAKTSTLTKLGIKGGRYPAPSLS
jgi:vancomycin resistance protein YoaR